MKNYSVKKFLVMFTILITVSIISAKVNLIDAEKNMDAMQGHGNKPNIIIILADDLGCGDISLYNGWISTPRIDQMAKEGVMITDFHSNSSVCSPTRAALLTGGYQQRVRIIDVIAGHLETPGLEATEPTISRLMKEDGYRTALFGKWHLGSEPQNNPIHHGFDEFIFLYVSHQAVHNYYQIPSDPPGTRGRDIPLQGDEARARYKIMLKGLDDSVGEILDVLNELELDENIFVFFFSDNGDVKMSPHDRPYRGGKFSNYEGGHRVPAVARWPGHIRGGWISNELAPES